MFNKEYAVFAGNEVFYIDCTNIPLEHLELLIREVYLPLMCTNQGKIATGGDKVMDILHRLMSVVEVSQGHVEVSAFNLKQPFCIKGLSEISLLNLGMVLEHENYDVL